MMLHGTGLITKENLFLLAWGWKNYKKNLLVLKYYPNHHGDRTLNGVNFKKVPTPLYNFNGCIKIMKSISPDFVKYDPFYGREIIEVPLEKIKSILEPKKRVQEILNSPKDYLEREFVRIVKTIKDYTDVDVGSTASLLFNLHRPNSDIDLIFYGDLKTVKKIKNILKDLIDDGSLRVQINENEMKILFSIFQDKGRLDHAISEWVYSFSLKDSRTEVHVLFVPNEETIFKGEITNSKKQVITGSIIDASHSVYCPASFLIKTSFGNIECISYSRSGNLVRKGDILEARGTLTQINDNGTSKCYFILLDQKEDYLNIK